MKINQLEKLLSQNEYPGRGIVAGLSEDGKYAVSAYWTMGRSAGSRNRIFTVETEDGSEVVRTKAFDPSLIAGDPSLIIYAAVRQFKNSTIVTNGDQTDTIFEGLKEGKRLILYLRKPYERRRRSVHSHDGVLPEKGIRGGTRRKRIYAGAWKDYTKSWCVATS